MVDNYLEKMQKANLIMLKEVNRICKKHNIKFRLEAGSMIGAVRHKGFIPWDDDCDIAFLRDEYEKFKKVLETEKLEDGIVFVKASSNKDYFHDFVDRIFYTKILARDGDEFKNRFGGFYQYPYLDIFILDNLLDITSDSTFFRQKAVYGKAMGHRHDVNFSKYKGALQNYGAMILSIIGKFKSLEKLYKEHENISKEYIELIDSEYVYYSNYPAIWMGYKNLRSSENDLIEVPFEDITLPIVKDYDRLLKYLYGDYMKFPEKEKQIPEHRYKIW